MNHSLFRQVSENAKTAPQLFWGPDTPPFKRGVSGPHRCYAVRMSLPHNNDRRPETNPSYLRESLTEAICAHAEPFCGPGVYPRIPRADKRA